MTISQNIAYAVLTVNGYKYKYNYNESDKELHKEFIAKTGEGATVRWQSKTDITAYTQPIYPSDIPKENKVNTNLKIVYSIDITNNTNTNIEGYYIEKKMKVESLKNTFDTNRYIPTLQAKDTDTFKSWDRIEGKNNEVTHIGREFEGGIRSWRTQDNLYNF